MVLYNFLLVPEPKAESRSFRRDQESFNIVSGIKPIITKSGKRVFSDFEATAREPKPPRKIQLARIPRKTLSVSSIRPDSDALENMASNSRANTPETISNPVTPTIRLLFCS